MEIRLALDNRHVIASGALVGLDYGRWLLSINLLGCTKYGVIIIFTYSNIIKILIVVECVM
jgi:hypothetical protein